MHPFRFGYQFGGVGAQELRRVARAAESAGFDVFSSWDHAGPSWTPLLPLLAAADATERLRLCPMVINNDFHHPVQLAAEVANLDHLSGGRVELGLGAGHAFPEYEALGLAFEPPALRKARMAEALEIIRPLLDGEEVSFEGQHYRLNGARTMRSLQPRLPILVGVNGRRALSHAARHADIIGLTMLGRTLPDGQRHEVRWQPERLDTTVGYIRAEAGDRWPRLELNALVQAVVFTTNRLEAARQLSASAPGLSLEDALATPFLAIGTEAEIADHFRACRQRWGISYFTVRSLEEMAPVIAALRE